MKPQLRCNAAAEKTAFVDMHVQELLSMLSKTVVSFCSSHLCPSRCYIHTYISHTIQCVLGTVRLPRCGILSEPARVAGRSLASRCLLVRLRGLDGRSTLTMVHDCVHRRSFLQSHALTVPTNKTTMLRAHTRPSAAQRTQHSDIRDGHLHLDSRLNAAHASPESGGDWRLAGARAQQGVLLPDPPTAVKATASRL